MVEEVALSLADHTSAALYYDLCPLYSEIPWTLLSEGAAGVPVHTYTVHYHIALLSLSECVDAGAQFFLSPRQLYICVN